MLSPRKKWVLVVLIVALVAACYFREKEITHITLNDKLTMIPIPPEIVKSKDCDKYHEWFYSHMTPLTAQSDRCPWAKPPKGPIGEFVVNGVKFWIPRKYLWPDTQTPDGYDNHITLLMIYPDMGPPSDKPTEDERNYEVLVSLRSTYNYDACRIKKDCDPSQSWYTHVADFKHLTEEERKTYPKNLGHVPELGLTMYKHRPGAPESLYIKEDKDNPSYWLICDDDNPTKDWSQGGCRSCLSCESYFNWSNKLYLKYRFHRVNLLPHHNEVRQKIINRLKEFQQEPRGRE